MSEIFINHLTWLVVKVESIMNDRLLTKFSMLKEIAENSINRTPFRSFLLRISSKTDIGISPHHEFSMNVNEQIVDEYFWSWSNNERNKTICHSFLYLLKTKIQRERERETRKRLISIGISKENKRKYSFELLLDCSIILILCVWWCC